MQMGSARADMIGPDLVLIEVCVYVFVCVAVVMDVIMIVVQYW